MELLGIYEVSVFNYSETELEKDILIHKPIISDTSCLILLDKIGELEFFR